MPYASSDSRAANLRLKLGGNPSERSAASAGGISGGKSEELRRKEKGARVSILSNTL